MFTVQKTRENVDKKSALTMIAKNSLRDAFYFSKKGLKVSKYSKNVYWKLKQLKNSKIEVKGVYFLFLQLIECKPHFSKKEFLRRIMNKTWAINREYNASKIIGAMNLTFIVIKKTHLYAIGCITQHVFLLFVTNHLYIIHCMYGTCNYLGH